MKFQSEELTSVSAVSSVKASTTALEGALSMSDFKVIILGEEEGKAVLSGWML